ncbi:recombinase family protein [Kineococcus sp. SYSU DK006]|uniref:recombinase family protein n=1 Tax=Kineococcus sp. SYSU DK006 TaxID=3383127 RepID=UPI003D7E369B
MPAHLLGYARVSATAQDPALQYDALTAADCYRVWTDTASGALTARSAASYCTSSARWGSSSVTCCMSAPLPAWKRPRCAADAEGDRW